jgi:hypothetical protein
MDWLSKYKVLIDCAKKSVKLITLDGNELVYLTEPIVTAKEATREGLHLP